MGGSLHPDVAQGAMGAALDTWKTHWLLDTAAITFHESRVRLLTQEPRTWLSDRSSAVYPVGIDGTRFQIGNHPRLLGIATACFYLEQSEERDLGEAGIEDLEQIWDAAIRSNEYLTWFEGEPGWPAAIPAAVANESIATALVDQLPTQYAEFLDEDDQRCGQLVATFVGIYTVRFSDC